MSRPSLVALKLARPIATSVVLPSTITATALIQELDTAVTATHTTASFNVVAGRRYFVYTARGTASTADTTTPVTITTSISGIHGVTTGTSGWSWHSSAYQNDAATPRRTDLHVGHATATGSGTVTITAPGAGWNDSLPVIVIEVGGLHYVDSSFDGILKDRNRDYISSPANGTSVTASLHPFADATYNAGIFFLMTGQNTGAITMGSWGTRIASVTGSPPRSTAVGFHLGEVTRMDATWPASASHAYLAYELRAAGTAAPAALNAVPTAYGASDSGTTLSVPSIPFTSGRPVLLGVTCSRASAPAAPTSVVSTTFTFTEVASSVIAWDTSGTPTRRTSWWLCVPGSTATETVTVTWGVTHTGKAGVAVDLYGAATTGTVVQGVTVTSQLVTSQSVSLSAFGAARNGCLVAYSIDGGTPINPLPQDGYAPLCRQEALASINAADGLDGNNMGSYPAGSAPRRLHVIWRPSAPASLTAGVDTLSTARDIAVSAIEIKAA